MEATGTVLQDPSDTIRDGRNLLGDTERRYQAYEVNEGEALVFELSICRGINSLTAELDFTRYLVVIKWCGKALTGTISCIEREGAMTDTLQNFEGLRSDVAPGPGPAPGIQIRVLIKKETDVGIEHHLGTRPSFEVELRCEEVPLGSEDNPRNVENQSDRGENVGRAESLLRDIATRSR